MDLKKELVELQYEFGILEEIDCTDSENEAYSKLLREKKPLPKGVFYRCHSSYNDEYGYFFTIKETPLSKEERAEYFQYKQLKTLITIKKCVVFFTVLSIIALVISLFSVLPILFS